MKKVILITGASRGIGNNIARSLAHENIVIANYNKSEDEAKKLKSDLKEEDIDIDIIKADVSNRTEVKEMI
jgi:3-oxoacyl-[acyl-carrier protein] reductase